MDSANQPIGISFLYAVWHSPVVRSQLSLDDVDFTVLAATSVLDDLIEKCPPAEACRDAFVRMSKATIKMCLQTGGFGSQGGFSDQAPATQSSAPMDIDRSISQQAELPVDPNLTMAPPQQRMVSKNLPRRPVFDMDLRDLFSDEETAARPLSRLAYYPIPPLQTQFQPPPNPNIPIKRESVSTTSKPLSPQAYQGSGLQGPNAITTAALNSPTSTSIPPANLAARQQNAYSLSNQAPYSNFAAQIQTQYPMMSPLSDLDFLDTLPLGGDANAGAGNGMGQAAHGFSDFDLALGMGWDGNLPGQGWGDDSGGNLDLFDGFFSGWRNNGNGI